VEPHMTPGKVCEFDEKFLENSWNYFLKLQPSKQKNLPKFENDFK